MVIKKSDIARPVRRSEVMQVDELKGEVVIQQMTLEMYLSMLKYGSTHDNTAPMSMVLAACVLDADGTPVFDEQEWEAWAPANLKIVFELYARIKKLSGVDLDDAVKN